MKQFKTKFCIQTAILLLFVVIIGAAPASARECGYTECGWYWDDCARYLCYWLGDEYICECIGDYVWRCPYVSVTCYPKAPSNVSVEAVEYIQNRLTWSYVSGHTYNVYFSTDPGVTKTNKQGVITGITGGEFTHPALIPGKTYYYVVTAVDSENDESTISSEVSVRVISNGDVDLYLNLNTGDHFYTYRYNAAWWAALDYEFRYTAFAVMKYQQTGTLPLRQYIKVEYDEDTGELLFADHFYTTKKNDAWWAAFGYDFQEVAGYVYSDQASNTVPLFQYIKVEYDEVSGDLIFVDHFYTTEKNDQWWAAFGYEYEEQVGYVYPMD